MCIDRCTHWHWQLHTPASPAWYTSASSDTPTNVHFTTMTTIESLQYRVTPLHQAVWVDDRRSCKLLLEAGANPNATNEVRTHAMSMHHCCLLDAQRTVPRDTVFFVACTCVFTSAASYWCFESIFAQFSVGLHVTPHHHSGELRPSMTQCIEVASSAPLCSSEPMPIQA